MTMTVSDVASTRIEHRYYSRRTAPTVMMMAIIREGGGV